MPIARAGALLVCAVATAALAACFGPRMSTEAPTGVSLAGNWKLDPAASDDPQKTLALMRAEAQKIINRANAAQGRPETPPPGAAGADASGPPAHGARRDPLQYSAMAHVVEALLERSDHLSIRQAADEMVFDWSTSRRSFVPGAHSVVSAEGGVGDQTSGWDGKQYVVSIKPQMGPLITDSFGLSADGKHLVEKVHVDQYELPAVTITRTYNPTTETGPRPLSSGD